jgi:hypothetical protein
MISSMGAAVGSPGANADSSGVTGRTVLVGDVRGEGTNVSVGSAVGAAVQPWMRRMEMKRGPI